MLKMPDTSKELLISRHLNGIKLLRPQKNDASFTVRPPSISVSDILNYPFSVFFTDTNHSIREINDASWASCGFQSRTDALGGSIASVCNNQNQVIKVFDNNFNVMKSSKMSILNEEADIASETHLQCLSFKFPWYDENNRIAGVFGCALEIVSDKLSTVASHLSMIASTFIIQPITVQNVLTGKNIENNYFSKREIELIKLLVHGKTIRQCAEMLGISHRTAESYYENVKCKSGVNTKSQLIEKLIHYFV